MSAKRPEFRDVFEGECPYVWNTLRRLGVHEGDLGDLTQDVFVTVHHLLDDYDPNRPLRPWLFGIAYRVALHYKSRFRYAREVLHESPDAVDPSPAPDEKLAKEQARALVVDAIRAIEIHRRAVFTLSDIDGYAMPEIAEALGIPLNTAYSRLRLAREEFARAVRRLESRRGVS